MASVCSKTLDLDNSSVEFAFSDGSAIAVALSEYTPETVLHLTLHGISQKLGDAFSGVKGDVAEAKKRLLAVHEQLKAGDWRAARGEGEAKPRVGELAEAIARIKNVPVEEVVKALESASEDDRKAMRSNERVKAVIAVIRSEKAQAKLAKLGDAGDDIPLDFGTSKKTK